MPSLGPIIGFGNGTLLFFTFAAVGVTFNLVLDAVMRRVVSPEVRHRAGPTAAVTVQVLATIYAVLVAFVIVNQYTGRMPVFHIDAYRTESLTELLDIGFDEYVSGDSVTVIEWSDKLEPLLPPGALRVRISGLGDEPRTIRIDAPEPRL